jgi:hypothetical protein
MAHYPPTARWRHLTRAEQRERMEASADLRELLQWHRGDPRASSSEEQFLTSIVRLIETYHGAAGLTREEWDKIWEVLDKLGTDFADTDNDDDLSDDELAA